MYTHVHSSIIHNSKEMVAGQVSIDILMENVVYITEYYPTFLKKEILSHATTWMNLEDAMLRKISQSAKDKRGVALLS